MNEKLILKAYEKIKEEVELNTFKNTINGLLEDYSGMDFMTEESILDLAVGQFLTQEVTPISDITDETISKIDELESGMEHINIIGRVLRVRTPRQFTTRKGKHGQYCKITIADDTQEEVNVTFWNKKVHEIEHLENNQFIKITDLDVKTKYMNDDEIELSSSNRTEVYSLVSDDEEYPVNPGEYPKSNIKFWNINNITKVDTFYSLTGIINRIREPIHFIKKDETDGYVQNISIQDKTGQLHLTLWGENTQNELQIGDLITIINAKCERDDYNPFNNYKLNTGYDTDLILIENEEEEYKDLINLREQLKPVKLANTEILEHNTEINVQGRILFNEELRTFNRNDGSVGKLKNYVIADETSVVSLTCWDSKAEMILSSGDCFCFENVKVNLRSNDVGLSCNKISRIIPIATESLPSTNELLDKYMPFVDNLEDVEEYTPMRLKGELVTINPLRLIKKCPYCNEGLTENGEGELICEACGNEITEPKNILHLNTEFLLDEETTVQVNFYNQNIAELINMDLDNIFIICDTDSSTIDSKISNLQNEELTLLCNSYYNNYIDEICFTVKKIL